MPGLLRRDPAQYFTVASLASFGVLGWLLVQWLSVSVAEHAHRGHGVEVHHHHPYAGPLALAMALTAACSLLGVFAARLRLRPVQSSAPNASKLLVAPASVAAGLFVVVESFELHALGREHDTSAMAFLFAGAALHLLVLPMSWALNRRAVTAAHRCADRLRPPRAILVPQRTLRACSAPPQVRTIACAGVQRVRGPPTPHRFPILLLPEAKPARV